MKRWRECVAVLQTECKPRGCFSLGFSASPLPFCTHHFSLIFSHLPQSLSLSQLLQ